ncbi:hypothetical protein C8Q74DRAFT_1340109, partial [Fomes fomentarius]
MDGFNAEGKGGAYSPLTACYLVCYDLPPALRYKTENMFLFGVLPGHPHMEEINHLLELVACCFRRSYLHGVWYTNTPLHSDGILSRCAIVPIVADLLAARQMSGTAPHNHIHFCNFCMQELWQIEDLDYWKWRSRTCKEHRKIAERWRDAETEDEKKTIWKEYGIRWTPLLSLPYWDPSSFIALDTMHLFYLGCFHRHCELVWGMSGKQNDGLDGIAYDPSNKPPRIDHGIANADGSLQRPRNKRTRVLGRQRLRLIWEDMENTTFPSWFSPAPSRVSESASTSGMKADQWRSFCTVHLPISMIYLWGCEPESSREFLILDNFMDLVSAIKLGSMRLQTTTRRALFRQYMHKYLKGLLELYPGTTITPGQHLCLHWPDVAENIGPAPATRSFAFENTNLVLQQIETNHKPGDLSGTLLSRFSMQQMLQYMISQQNLPSELWGIISPFMDTFRSRAMGTLFEDTTGHSSVPASRKSDDSRQSLTQLSEEEFALLQTWLRNRQAPHDIIPFVHSEHEVTKGGLRYTTYDTVPRDSNIIFPTEDRHDWRAGRVVRIFRLGPSHRETDTVFLVVDCYEALNNAHAERDPC